MMTKAGMRRSRGAHSSLLPCAVIAPSACPTSLPAGSVGFLGRLGGNTTAYIVMAAAAQVQVRLSNYQPRTAD